MNIAEPDPAAEGHKANGARLTVPFVGVEGLHPDPIDEQFDLVTANHHSHIIGPPQLKVIEGPIPLDPLRLIEATPEP